MKSVTAKLYDEMSGQALARVYFASAARHDVAECERIVAARALRRSRLDIFEWLMETSTLLRLMSCWGIHYWRARYAEREALWQFFCTSAQQTATDDTVNLACQQHQRLQSYAVAVDRVLDPVCDEYGIDAGMLRIVACIDGNELVIPGVTVYPEDEVHARKMLTDILDDGEELIAKVRRCSRKQPRSKPGK